jgi:hypothetical protein
MIPGVLRGENKRPPAVRVIHAPLSATFHFDESVRAGFIDRFGISRSRSVLLLARLVLSASQRRERIIAPSASAIGKKDCWPSHAVLPYRAPLSEPFPLRIFGAIRAMCARSRRVNTFLARFKTINPTFDRTMPLQRRPGARTEHVRDELNLDNVVFRLAALMAQAA